MESSTLLILIPVDNNLLLLITQLDLGVLA